VFREEVTSFNNGGGDLVTGGIVHVGLNRWAASTTHRSKRGREGERGVCSGSCSIKETWLEAKFKPKATDDGKPGKRNPLPECSED